MAHLTEEHHLLLDFQLAGVAVLCLAQGYNGKSSMCILVLGWRYQISVITHSRHSSICRRRDISPFRLALLKRL